MQDPSYTKPFSRVPYKEIEIDFLEDNDMIAYTFQFEGNNYGSGVKLKSRKRKELVEATALLIINAITSFEQLKNDTNSTTGTGTTSN